MATLINAILPVSLSEGFFTIGNLIFIINCILLILGVIIVGWKFGIKIQYRVLIPNFQPTIITPRTRSIQLIMKIKLPMVKKPAESDAGRMALISVAKPAAPPPIPPAGNTHICQPKA